MADLIAERAGTTVRAVATGFTAGWLAALLMAAAAAMMNKTFLSLVAVSLGGGLLSTPSALLAIFCLIADLPPSVAIAAVVFPRVLPHALAQFRSTLRAPHVAMARARGVSSLRLFVWHVIPATTTPLIALSGAMVPLAFGAAIPIESLADSPGLGQLVWRAALGRDMAVLVSVTLLLTTVTIVANLLSDLVLSGDRARAL